MNPEHLIEQAERLLAVNERGAPRQADKRRAVSAAYYALFHALARSVTNESVGHLHRLTPRYTLVYRSVAHARLRDLCADLAKSTMPAKYAPFADQGAFSTDLKSLAKAFVDLQLSRHRADYDPLFKINTAAVQLEIERAKSALERLSRLQAAERQSLATLALFEPKH